MLTDHQIKVLLQGIRPSRVQVRDNMSNVEGYDIRAMLIRIFGFANWCDTELREPTLLYAKETTTRAGKPAVKVAYMAHRRLTINDIDGHPLASYDGSAVGESTMPDFKEGDCYDMAVKTAETQALKRAATNLGDQFGLSLYKDGSIDPLVRKLTHGPTLEEATTE